jgi:iron uptake system component EfeO
MNGRGRAKLATERSELSAAEGGTTRGRRPLKVLSALLLAVALCGVACSSSKAGAGGVTEVVATDDSCKPAKTTFAAGKQSFEIQNDGKQVTELYVYGKDDNVIGEVENVGPDTSRRLTVDLKPGTYELACKPGQTGRGIRVPITVT